MSVAVLLEGMSQYAVCAADCSVTYNFHRIQYDLIHIDCYMIH